MPLEFSSGDDQAFLLTILVALMPDVIVSRRTGAVLSSIRLILSWSRP